MGASRGRTADRSKLAINLRSLVVWPSGVGPYSLAIQSNSEQYGSSFCGSCLGLNLSPPQGSCIDCLVAVDGAWDGGL